MRMRKKKHTESRLALCADLLVTEPETKKGLWRSLFGESIPADAPLFLEIGCGKGAFILEMAKREPKTLFVAVEESFHTPLDGDSAHQSLVESPVLP